MYICIKTSYLSFSLAHREHWVRPEVRGRAAALPLIELDVKRDGRRAASLLGALRRVTVADYGISPCVLRQVGGFIH